MFFVFVFCFLFLFLFLFFEKDTFILTLESVGYCLRLETCWEFYRCAGQVQ